MIFLVIRCTRIISRWYRLVQVMGVEDCDRSRFHRDLPSISSKQSLKLLSLHGKLPSLKPLEERREMALGSAILV